MIKIEGTWLDEKRTLRIEDRGPEVMLETNGTGCIRVSRQELIQKLHPEGAAEVEKYKKENQQLLSWVKRMERWLLAVAAQSDNQERINRGSFNTLADANAADARNYRAMAKDATALIKKAK